MKEELITIGVALAFIVTGLFLTWISEKIRASGKIKNLSFLDALDNLIAKFFKKTDKTISSKNEVKKEEDKNGTEKTDD